MNEFEVRVLDNEASSIGAALEEQLESSEAADIAVAFARRSGLQELEALPRFQQRGGKLRFLAGTDFQQTEVALFDSLNIGAGTEVRLSVLGAGPALRRAFHPKLYVCRSATRVSALIGSANFTRGGLRTNVETAVLLSGHPGARPLREAVDAFARYWMSPLSVPLTDSLRQAYETLRLARAEALQAATLDQDAVDAAARLRDAVSDLLVPPASLAKAAGSTWLLVTSSENFRLCMAQSLWGDDDQSRIEKMKPGDRVLFYVKVLSAIGAAGLVTGRVYRDITPYWPDSAYAYRLPLHILLRPDPQVAFKPILPQLAGFPKGKSWGTALQTSQKLLSPGDADALWEITRRASAPIRSAASGQWAAERPARYRP